jgi:predicted  nucleic acid-binding Zn-ribbon protein
MSDPIFWAIFSVATAITVTVLASLIALISYNHHRAQAIRFWEREQRLPDATRLANLSVQIENLREEYRELKDNVFDAQQIIETANHQRQWMESTRDEISKLEQDKKEVIRIQNELETAQLQLASLNEQKSMLDGELAQRKETLVQLEKQEIDMRKEFVKYELELEKANSLRAEMKNLETRKAEINNDISELQTAANTLRNKLETELTEIRFQRSDAARDLESLTKQLESRKKEVTEHEESLKQLKDSIDNLRKEEQGLDRILQEMRAQAQKANQLANELDELERKRKTTQAEADTLDHKLREIRRQKEEATEETKNLKASIEKFMKEQEQLEAERRRLKTEVEKLESKANALGAQIPVMQTAFDSLSSAVIQQGGQATSEVSDIWSPVLAVHPSSEKDARDEIESLEGLHRYLSDLGLKFDKRILYAFHTSLKSSDSSTLVTLAGVSGTGKSELPRRYAEAMGINFLNVAVQPRWDSPQDLFGFYDYLDRRFRPTELARALTQMDPIGAQDERGWNPPSEFEQHRIPGQLLLVLLDEMNLARVEYYFSEFLSRLETRRSIDKSSAEKRKAAEISLDIGGRRSGHLPMQLFIDENVLFVGTMNEDETTQALSDKVLDRANVLRFGSPNSITPLPQNGPPPKQKRVSSLPWKTWSKWHKTKESLVDVVREKHLAWIEKIRREMINVNRPFAHRVANSILEYAANYPAIDGQFNYAVSDQVEQKILPKLIGLNPKDASVRRVFSAIKEVLNNADDEKLIDRMEACCRDDYFQWSGIDRFEA